MYNLVLILFQLEKMFPKYLYKILYGEMQCKSSVPFWLPHLQLYVHTCCISAKD